MKPVKSLILMPFHNFPLTGALVINATQMKHTMNYDPKQFALKSRSN